MKDGPEKQKLAFWLLIGLMVGFVAALIVGGLWL